MEYLQELEDLESGLSALAANPEELKKAKEVRFKTREANFNKSKPPEPEKTT